MNTNKNKSVESKKDSVATPEAAAASATPVATPAATGLMNVPVTQSDNKKGNGTSYQVWGKKDLVGKGSFMAGKEDDRVINKGDIVKDPETGQDIYLIRIHRGKRVWYSKGALEVAVQAPVEVAAEVQE
jgi:hypothetical protein